MFGVYIQEVANSWSCYICVCVYIIIMSTYMWSMQGILAVCHLPDAQRKQYRHPLTLSSQQL